MLDRPKRGISFRGSKTHGQLVRLTASPAIGPARARIAVLGRSAVRVSTAVSIASSMVGMIDRLDVGQPLPRRIAVGDQGEAGIGAADVADQHRKANVGRVSNHHVFAFPPRFPSRFAGSPMISSAVRALSAIGIS